MGAIDVTGDQDGRDTMAASSDLTETIIVGGVKISTLDRAGWARKMLADVALMREQNVAPKFSTTAKGQTLPLMRRDAEFAAALRKADSIAPDGASILWGAKYFAKRPLPERVATTDVFHNLACAAQDHDVSFYMFGASPEVNARAVATVKALYPRLRLVGSRHGYFASGEEDQVIADIVATKPDIVWVGLGVPRQEKFVARNLEKFRGVTWVKTCGGLFDFLGGRVSRAPQWMQDRGLEWLYRVVLEPRRLFWRYASTNGPALYLMFRDTPVQCRGGREKHSGSPSSSLG